MNDTTLKILYFANSFLIVLGIIFNITYVFICINYYPLIILLPILYRTIISIVFLSAAFLTLKQTLDSEKALIINVIILIIQAIYCYLFLSYVFVFMNFLFY